MACALCEKEHTENLYEVCDCKQFVHIDCFIRKFANNTQITYYKNYAKLVIEDFGCKVCGQRYESKLTSVHDLGEGSALFHQNAEIQQRG